jgi:hypothetical protein
MHLRRALLLFAIVLGVAAIAASLAPPPDRQARDRDRTAPPPPVAQQPEAGSRPAGGQTVRVSLAADAKQPATKTVAVREHVVLTVSAKQPGEVGLEGFGLTAGVEPRTPAVFDLFPAEPGRHAVLYRPVGGEPRRAGTLVVRDAGSL